MKMAGDNDEGRGQRSGAPTTEHTEYTERRGGVFISSSVYSVYSVVNSEAFSGRDEGLLPAEHAE